MNEAHSTSRHDHPREGAKRQGVERGRDELHAGCCGNAGGGNSNQRHDAQQGTAGQADDGRRPGGRPDVFGAVKWSAARSRISSNSNADFVYGRIDTLPVARLQGGVSNCGRSLRHNADHQSRQLLGAERWSAMPSVGGWSTSASDCLWRRRSKNFASSPRLIAVRGSRDGCGGARGRASAMGIWGGVNWKTQQHRLCGLEQNTTTNSCDKQWPSVA